MPFKNEAELVVFEEAENKRLTDIYQNRLIAELGPFGADIVTRALNRALLVDGQLARVDAMRSDNDLAVAISKFKDSAFNAAMRAIDEAMFAGYSTDIKGRAEITRRQPGTFNFVADPDQSDRAALAGWPIFGNMRTEIAANLVENMLFKLNALITGPLRREIDIAAIPQVLENLRNQFAKDVASQAQQAYLTGTQASQQQIKTAIMMVAEEP